MRKALAPLVLAFIAATSLAVRANVPGFDGGGRGTNVPAGAPVLAPLAFLVFCRANPGDCSAAPRKGGEGVEGDARLLASVNEAVNAAIVPDMSRLNALPQRWSANTHFGICNDYAITKRHRLMALGFDPKHVLLAQVVTRSGQAHMVLIVRTKTGDVVLDNLTPKIGPWSARPYHWVKRQSEDDPSMWVAVSAR